MTEVKAIQHDLGVVLPLSKKMKLPPGLLKQLMDTFNLVLHLPLDTVR